jgi:hypothetical protein
MATGFGFKTSLGFATEITYGTYVAAAKFLEITEESIERKAQRISKPFLGTASQKASVPGKVSVGGGIKTMFAINGSERLLYHAMGTDATTGAGPYTHAYALAAALPVGLSFHIDRDSATVGGSSAFRYTGCQIKKMMFSQKEEDFLMMDLDIIGQQGANGAAEAATYPTFAGFDWTQFTLTVAGSAMTVKGFEISLENDLADDRYYLGAKTIRGLGRKGARKITGKITKEFESLTEFQLFSALTASTLSAVWTDGTNTLTIACPRIFFEGSEPNAKDGGPFIVDMPFTAYQSAAIGDEMTLTLINTTASGV